MLAIGAEGVVGHGLASTGGNMFVEGPSSFGVGEDATTSEGDPVEVLESSVVVKDFLVVEMDVSVESVGSSVFLGVVPLDAEEEGRGVEPDLERGGFDVFGAIEF